MSNTNGREQAESESLSHNQVESLVKAMETFQPSASQWAQPESPPDAIDPRIRATIRSLHERIAVDLTGEFGNLLRTAVDIRVSEVSAVTVEEFDRQAAKYRWLSVMSPHSLPGDWCLELAPQLCCAMVDRMLGGVPTPGETFSRPMTDIERRLVQRVVDSALQSLLRGWQVVDQFTWIVRHPEAIEPNAALPTRGEQLLQTRFDVSLCGDRTSMRLGIPVSTLLRLQERLGQRDWKIDLGAGDRGCLSKNVASTGVDVVVTLARSTILSGDLLDLNIGDIIATEKGVAEPLELAIQNIPKFKTQVGSLNGKKAVQIQSQLDRTATDRESPVPHIITAKNPSDDEERRNSVSD